MNLLAALIALAAPTLDVRVEGPGYLRMAFDGRIVYSTYAKLEIRDGRIADANGATLMPLVSVPQGSSGISIEPDGTIQATKGTQSLPIGRISLAIFPDGSRPLPKGHYLVASARPKLVNPGDPDVGVLVVSGNMARVGNSATPVKGANQEMLAIEIQIPSKAEVSDKRVTLDLFSRAKGHDELVARLKTIDFGPTPRPGSPMKITRERILAKLKLAGIAEPTLKLDCPPVVQVGMVGQTVDSERFFQAAIQYANEKLGTHEYKPISEPVSLTVPLGEVELRGESVARRGDSIIASIAAYVNGRRCNSVTVTLEGAGGQIVVKAGDLVKVVFAANGIAVELNGRAKRSGRVGESIEVEVTTGDPPVKTSHLAVVRSAGMVEVKI